MNIIVRLLPCLLLTLAGAPGSLADAHSQNSLFGYGKTPAERMREHQRSLNKAQRELDRERTKLEQQEKKLVTDIKKAARNNQMVSSLFRVSVSLFCLCSSILCTARACLCGSKGRKVTRLKDCPPATVSDKSDDAQSAHSSSFHYPA